MKMQSVFDDASRRSADAAEMHDRTCNLMRDVEGIMLQRESHLMSEIESRTQESLRVQVTRQREEMQSLLAEQQKIEDNPVSG